MPSLGTKYSLDLEDAVVPRLSDSLGSRRDILESDEGGMMAVVREKLEISRRNGNRTGGLDSNNSVGSSLELKR